MAFSAILARCSAVGCQPTFGTYRTPDPFANMIASRTARETAPGNVAKI